MDRDLMDTVWHPDDTTDYGPPCQGSASGLLDVMRASHAKLLGHSHQVTNGLIEVDGDRAASEAYVTGTIWDLTDAGALRHLVAVGRYLDRWSRRDGRRAIGHNPGAWWNDVEVNLRGTFLCTHAALPHMVSGSGGHIVNVVSMAAVMPWPYDSAYACSKAAVVRLTDSVAEEVREQGVRLFALSPGSVDTELRAGAVDSPAGRKWLTRVNPNPRWVPAELSADAVVFLASGAADGLTGRFLSVDWDLLDLARRAADIERRDVLQLRLNSDQH